MKHMQNSGRVRIRLVATNPMRIAGLQGVYGDPCGIDLIPVTSSEALCLTEDPLLMIDAGSVHPLFDLLNRLHHGSPRAQVIVIGTDADETYIECVISAGAKGFLTANATAEEFRAAIQNVRDGAIWAPHNVLSRLLGKQADSHRHSPQKTVPLAPLTPRETEVLRLLLGGQGNREIGENLGIDPITVKCHLGRIMRKAGVGNRVELTMYALHRQRDSLPAQPRSRR